MGVHRAGVQATNYGCVGKSLRDEEREERMGWEMAEGSHDRVALLKTPD